MELTQIRYFLEVAQTQHMTKTAQKLHISQPSLTQAIHRLEESLGVPLFMAKGRNIVLTEYGRYLKKKLEPIVEEIDKLPEKMKIMAKLSTETIHLNVLAASSLVTEAVIDFKQNRKNLNFQLLQNDESDIYDIEIRTEDFSQDKNNDRKLDVSENKFICEEKIFLIVPNIEKYRDISSISLHDVKDEGFISLAGSKQFFGICNRFCKNVGFKPNIIFESDNLSAVKNMIKANMGIGFWPEFTWGTIDEEHFKLLKISDGNFKRDVIISYNLNKMDNGNVYEFFEFLKEFCLKRRKSR